MLEHTELLHRPCL